NLLAAIVANHHTASSLSLIFKSPFRVILLYRKMRYKSIKYIKIIPDTQKFMKTRQIAKSILLQFAV
ncbi:MAG: hypothetical protein IKG82_11670, partial [Oscillospiraceae bacterium]|nr:hypothetical protein [Oscillospiraceae bacterium]